MIKGELHGLPGLTMQGTKGPEGKRGYTTFYSNITGLTTTKKEIDNNIEIINTSVNFIGYSADVNKIVYIPNTDLRPIIHDYVMNIEGVSTVTYEIVAICNLNLQNYASVTVEDIFSSDDSTPHATLEGDESYLTKEVFENIISSLSSACSVVRSKENDMSLRASWPVCLLRKLDSWTYSKKIVTSLTDLSVNISTKQITVPSWNGEYSTSIAQCDGHNYKINTEDIYTSFFKHRNDLLNKFYNSNGEILSEQIIPSENISVKIFNAYTKDLIVGIPVQLSCFKLTYNLLSGADQNYRDAWTNGSLSSLTEVPGHSVLVSETEWNKQYGTATIGSEIDVSLRDSTGETHPTLLVTSAEGYYPSYYVLSETDLKNIETVVKNDEGRYSIDMYIVPFDDNAEESFIIKDDYEYVDTSSPKTEYYDEESGLDLAYEDSVLFTQFEIFSNMSKEDKERTRIVIEFTTGQVKNNTLSSIRRDLWKGAPAEKLRNNIGIIDNYSYKMNFDNEDPGNFTLIIKDFAEGNSDQTYVSSVYLPQSLLSNEYDIEVYAYFKAGTASWQKVYLGKSGFADSLD